MDYELSIRSRKIFSDSADRMKRARKSATGVVHVGNKGEVRIKRDFRMNVMISDFNRSNQFSKKNTRREMSLQSVFDGLHLTTLHKFPLMISSKHKLRFSKSTTRFPLRIKMQS